MSLRVGIGLVGLRLDGPGAQPLVPADPDAVPRPGRGARPRRVQRHGRGAPGRGGGGVRLSRGHRRLARRLRAPRRRRRRGHGAEHAPRRRRRGRVRVRQARLLREARRGHARADRPGRSRRPRRRRDHRGRLQLPLRPARPPRGGADPGREPRRAHELPRPLLLDVRERPARSAELAVRAGRGRLRRLLGPAQPQRRPRAHARRPDRARGRDARHDHHGAPDPAAGRRALRPRPRGRSHRPGHERGLRRRARDLRERRARARSSRRAR